MDGVLTIFEVNKGKGKPLICSAQHFEDVCRRPRLNACVARVEGLLSSAVILYREIRNAIKARALRGVRHRKYHLQTTSDHSLSRVTLFSLHSP